MQKVIEFKKSKRPVNILSTTLALIMQDEIDKLVNVIIIVNSQNSNK